MKFAKKLMSVLLVVLMLATMALPAMADDAKTITIKSTVPGHTYTAYQILSGEVTTAGILSTPKWGTGLKDDDEDHVASFLSALKANDSFKHEGTNVFSGVTDETTFVGIVGTWGYNDPEVKALADVIVSKLTSTGYTSGTHTGNKYTISVPAAGYYLIKDTGALGTDGATDYLLYVTGSTEIAPKNSAPTFNKLVGSSETGNFDKAVDAQVGDKVWFRLETTLPSLFNDYKQFHAHYTDVLPAGLVPVGGSSTGKIRIEHADSSDPINLTATISVTPNYVDPSDHSKGITSTSLSLDLDDIKDQLPVNAELNLNDKIVIMYSATVTKDAVMGKNGADNFGNSNNAALRYTNDMNYEGEDVSKEATITSSANVYVYQAEFTKVDSASSSPLKGAKFHLYRNIGSSLEKNYAIIENSVITGWTTTKPADSAALVSGDDGKFIVKGLDALSYHLEEIDAPEGYNELKEPVLFTINSTITVGNLTGLSMTVDGATIAGTVDDGKVTGNIKNTPGTGLPATGGMGTTIFYIAGAVLLLGSITAFAVKKRGQN